MDKNLYHIIDNYGQFPERVIQYFIQEDPTRFDRIIRSCHESITDRQIRRIAEYFSDCFCAVHNSTYGNSTHYEILMQVQFGKVEKLRSKKIFFGIEPDLFWNTHIITGIRECNLKSLRVTKTVYAVDKKIFNWHKSRKPLFYS